MAATWEQLSGWQGGGCITGGAGTPPWHCPGCCPQGSWFLGPGEGEGQAEAPSEALGSSPREPCPGDPGTRGSRPPLGLGGTRAVDACPAQRAAGPSGAGGSHAGGQPWGPLRAKCSLGAQGGRGRAPGTENALRGGRAPSSPTGPGWRQRMARAGEQICPPGVRVPPEWGAVWSRCRWSVSGSLGWGYRAPGVPTGVWVHELQRRRGLCTWAGPGWCGSTKARGVGREAAPCLEAQGRCRQPEGGWCRLSALSVPAVGEFSQLPGSDR